MDMSDKGIQRYDYKSEYNKFACEDQVVFTTDDEGIYVKYDDHIAVNHDLYEALEKTLELALGLLDDHATYDPEEDDTVIKARKALAKARGVE